MSDPLQVLGTTVAGKYDVVDYLWQRGNRIAFRGLHRAWGEPVFLEFAVFDRSTDPGVLEAQRRAFMRAGAAVARICSRSTAVPQVRDGGTSPTALGDLPYAVSEWIEGSTVAAAVDKARRSGREKFPPELVLDWFEPAMDALALAHSDGVIHGHIGPETLMVTGGALGSRGIVKITGLVDAAWRKSLPAGSLPALAPAPGYAAPELGAGDPSLLGPWTDVYGVGAVMVELIAGTGDAAAWVAALPRELRYAFDKALATRIDERFKTLGAFRAALEEGVDSTDLGRSRNARRTMVVSEAVAELAGSAGTFESSDGHDTAPPDPAVKPPRVRLAYTQPSLPVPEELRSDPNIPVVNPVTQSGQTSPAMPIMPRPSPVQARGGSTLPLLILMIVVAVGGGIAVGFFLTKA